MTEKHSLYKWLIGFLSTFIIISVTLFMLELYDLVASQLLLKQRLCTSGLTVASKMRDELWNIWWLFDAYWEYGMHSQIPCHPYICLHTHTDTTTHLLSLFATHFERVLYHYDPDRHSVEAKPSQ